jgi:diguanylate cyclase (GGDEF)-like protein
MLNLAKEERIFTVEIEMIKNSYRFFILFRDITEELYLKEELEERANFDALTQIFNRSRFEFFLNKEIEKASRYGRSFSLIMFDIDHFKDINDTYGHDVGDVILKEITELVSSHTRDVDIFARWGGEEFMIISQTNIYRSEMFAEKLRQVIDQNLFTTVGTVTCSFGVTQYKKNDTLESIVKRCDNMLYSAKESGRNCVASLK